MIAGADDVRSRVLIAAAMVLTLSCAVGGAWVIRDRTHRLERHLAAQHLAAIATLAGAYPDQAARIAGLMTEAPDRARIERGKALLAQYGYAEDTASAVDPAFRPAAALPLLTALFVTIAGAAAAMLGAAALHGVYRRVERITADVAGVASGSYDVLTERLHPDREREGTLGRLSFQVRQTARRLSAHAEAADAGKRGLQDFLSDISHQLKTPLAAVRMYHELLLGGTRTNADRIAPHDRERFLLRSLSQIDRMEWLVRNLLTLARIEAGSLPLSLEPASLRATVTDIVESFRQRAEADGISLTAAVPDADPEVPHDRRWLGEALSNVVKNALDHTPHGGSVTVDLRHTGVASRITVDDTGPGILPQDLPHVFDRFYQGGSRGSAGTASPGDRESTGLGLALAKTIVQHHGGALSAVASPSGGARFIVTLPNLTKA